MGAEDTPRCATRVPEENHKVPEFYLLAAILDIQNTGAAILLSTHGLVATAERETEKAHGT